MTENDMTSVSSAAVSTQGKDSSGESKHDEEGENMNTTIR